MKHLFPLPDLILIPIFVSIAIGLLMLGSTASYVFPQYLAYVAAAIFCFVLFQKIDFEFLGAFSKFIYIGSLVLLVLPIIFGQVTRGVIRWIPIGSFSLQPAEIVRPALLLFFAFYFTSQRLTLKRFIVGIPLMGMPLALIFLQPSLGVTLITAAGFGGIILALNLKRKYLMWMVVAIILAAPAIWLFLAPYQKGRVLSLLSPQNDPLGAGYNSIQSTIAVGAGQINGRGLGRGVQTQLSFLPEKHTDFMFASIAEELGFVGAALTLSVLSILLFRLITFIDRADNRFAKVYIAGVFATMFAQTFIHIGMNMGILPITGLPLPLVSYGGSSLVSTMLMLALALQAGREAATIQLI